MIDKSVMKKIIIYTGIALITGLLTGYFLFRGDGHQDHHRSDQSGNATMYTCSMHPQIMQPEPGDCPICGMKLIPAEAGTDGLPANQFKMTDHAMALANIETTPVGVGTDTEKSLTLSGTVSANESTTGIQSAYFKGRIEKLYINTTGEEVRSGQLLATLYSPELIAAQQELLTTSTMKNEQPELYKAVRNKLKLWKLSEEQINTIESRGKVMENFPVYATVGGTVTEISVKEGDYINAGQPMFRVANLNTVWAVFDAYEKQLALLHKGAQIQITANAYPENAFTGTIDLIDPLMNASSRTADVRVTLSNKEGLLKPGMFVKGTVSATTETKGQLTLPKSAVLWTGKRSVVYIQPDPAQPVFELREITLGEEAGDDYQIVSGLEAGEYVVVRGAFTVDAAAQLQDKPSMMNRETEDKGLTATTLALPESFQRSVWPLINGYIDMNEAFVATAPEQVREKAQALLKTYDAIDASALGATEKKIYDKAGRMLVAMTNTNNIEDQRRHLVSLSDMMILLAKNVENLPQTIYVQNCPMANQYKGADWLSKKEKILNPYYGEVMLTCGSVTDTLTPAK